MLHRIVIVTLAFLALGLTFWWSTASPVAPATAPVPMQRVASPVDARSDESAEVAARQVDLSTLETIVTDGQPAEAPLEGAVGLPEPPANPDDWDRLQWRRYHMMKYYAAIEWDAEPSPNGNLGLLYRRALATLEEARGTGPLPSWDPDYPLLIPLGLDVTNDRLVLSINGDVYRFYPGYYPELQNWFDASQVGNDPSHELPPGASTRMSPETVEAIKGRVEEALLFLPSLEVR